jgi:hypothetical protein
MFKKSIYFLIALLIGAFSVFQSCNESPIDNQTSPIGEAGTNILTPNTFNQPGKLLYVNLPSNPQTPCSQLELWGGVGNANAGTLVGHVYFSLNLNGTLHVKYLFNDLDMNGIPDMYPYVPTSIHFDIADTLSGFHTNSSGNPVPGQFDYVYDIPAPYNIVSHEFDITIPDNNHDGFVYVAAHAGGTFFGEISGFNYYTPQNLTNLCVTTQTSQNGYWEFNLSNAGIMDGHYSGYCVDPGHWMTVGSCYPTKIFSTYGPLGGFDTTFAHPENLKLINWIVNNFTPGMPITKYEYLGPVFEPPFHFELPKFFVSGIQTDNILTMQDIQYAIWLLLCKATASPHGDWDRARIMGIVYKALTTAGANTFVPACNKDKIVAVVVPYYNNIPSVQLCIINYVVPCSSKSMTCWADGKYGANFPLAKQWGTWFFYKYNAPSCP